MEKKYSKPDFEIIEFKCEDIIMTSGNETDNETDLDKALRMYDNDEDRMFYGY